MADSNRMPSFIAGNDPRPRAPLRPPPSKPPVSKPPTQNEAKKSKCWHCGFTATTVEKACPKCSGHVFPTLTMSGKNINWTLISFSPHDSTQDLANKRAQIVAEIQNTGPFGIVSRSLDSLDTVLYTRSATGQSGISSMTWDVTKRKENQKAKRRTWGAIPDVEWKLFLKYVTCEYPERHRLQTRMLKWRTVPESFQSPV